MHLDITYVHVHNKIYDSKKSQNDLHFGTEGVYMYIIQRGSGRTLVHRKKKGKGTIIKK